MKKNFKHLFIFALLILPVIAAACAFSEPNPQPISGNIAFNQNEASLW